MHRDILPQVIFSPAALALSLAEGMQAAGAEVTLFSPGPVNTTARNITADLSYFEQELTGRGDTYIDLLKKHPLTFITLARQVQAELLAQAFAMTNSGQLDIVHVYTNEEDIALPMAQLCRRPVVLTHHDPFNFSVKYKNVFPKYASLNWISISLAQRRGMPVFTNWAANIYHGVDAGLFRPNLRPRGDYVVYLGRIIEPKGVHLAIRAVKEYNRQHGASLKLKIAGKHYAGHKKDTYWQERILPQIDGAEIEYLGFAGSMRGKQELLGNARTLIIPSVFEEPFGMVMIEALACGTPLVGLDSGAIPEVITHNQTGLLVQKGISEDQTSAKLAQALSQISAISRQACRQDFERRFTAARMCREHLAVYQKLTK